MRLRGEASLDPDDYAFRHAIRVRFAETDAMGIVHHSCYLPYLEEARVAYLRELDHPYTELRAEGVEHAVLECFVRYRAALRFDDVVDVHLALASATRTSFQLDYLLTVDDDVRATASTVHGAVTTDGRPTRLPSWLVAMAPKDGSPT
jgi:acyl-CoA thioester hydrolase